MKTLRDFFPSLRTRNEVFQEIQNNIEMRSIYNRWAPDEQERFLDICSGNRGLVILYDEYFQEIFNPDIAPERLITLLSMLLRIDIASIASLRKSSSLIEDNRTLMVLDIVVRLDDGSIVNVEVQKIGYLFPGHRASCYSSDLVLRQYRQVRSEKKKTFSYRDMKPVYSIIFMEKSPKEFYEFPEQYLHHFGQTSDTGLKLQLLQNYVFIPLDIFKSAVHNKGVKNLTCLEAWLLFLSSDDPEHIYALIEAYPEFRPMYEQIFEICCDTGRMMEMFSKELQMIDHNTVKLMIDEMQEELKDKDAELKSRDAELKGKDAELKSKDAELKSKDAELKSKDAELKSKDAELKGKDAELRGKDAELKSKDSELKAKDEELKHKDAELKDRDAEIQRKDEEIIRLREILKNSEAG